MFRTVPVSIIRSFFFHCTHSNTRTYRLADSLLASCQQTCMTYTIAVSAVKNIWWWTEELSETCRVLFQKYIWEISESSWFYCKNLSRCTAIWTSKTVWGVECVRFHTIQPSTWLRKFMSSAYKYSLELTVTYSSDTRITIYKSALCRKLWTRSNKSKL